MNPMMSLVGGDFTGQAAAAAAALGVQPGTLIATNSNNLYGFAHMGGLQHQLLQQTAAAAVFQNYAEVMDNEVGMSADVAGSALMNVGVGVDVGVGDSIVDDEDPQVYGQMEDGYDDGGSGLEPKQEIINIDEFVMDNNSYDGTDFMTSSDKDISQSSSSCMTQLPSGLGVPGTEHDLLVPLADGLLHHKLLGTTLSPAMGALNGNTFGNIMVGSEASSVNTIKQMQRNFTLAKGGTVPSTTTTSSTSGSSSNVALASTSSSLRTQRKTRKIEPVNRPGLELKTPIAYKGNIDPSVIPIQKDGMGKVSPAKGGSISVG